MGRCTRNPHRTSISLLPMLKKKKKKPNSICFSWYLEVQLCAHFLFKKMTSDGLLPRDTFDTRLKKYGNSLIFFEMNWSVTVLAVKRKGTTRNRMKLHNGYNNT